jgi:hypothetical protein
MGVGGPSTTGSNVVKTAFFITLSLPKKQRESQVNLCLSGRFASLGGAGGQGCKRSILKQLLRLRLIFPWFVDEQRRQGSAHTRCARCRA